MVDDPFLKSARRVYYKYQYRAKSRGTAFSIDFGTFRELAEKNCSYCGAEPVEVGSKRHVIPWKYNTIDRIINEKGYVEGNVQPCCKVCNKLKSNLSEHEFITIVSRIVCYMGSRLIKDERN